MKTKTVLALVLAVAAGCAHGPQTNQKDLALATDGLIREMKTYFCPNQSLIDHTLAVLSYAEQIHKGEGGDLLLVRAAAIYHDIGIPKAKEVHGSSAGQYQEIEGPPIARDILTKLDVEPETIDCVCAIIANHHTAHDEATVSTIEFKILWDADALVNLRRRLPQMEEPQRRQLIKEKFRTQTGHQIATELCL